MEIKYQIFDKENLFIQKFIGVFSFEYYKKFSRFVIENYASKSIEKILIDFRDLSFELITDYVPEDYHEKIEKIAEFRKNINQNELKNKSVKLVIWVDKPLPTVIAHLFITYFSHMNYHYCSTADNVIRFLELPEHLDLESSIKNVENTFENKL